MTIKLYIPGKLGGEPLAPDLIASTMQANRDHPAQRAVIQVIEAYAHEALAASTSENAILGGQAAPFLMAYAFFSNVLSDLDDYAAGAIPSPDRPQLQLRSGTVRQG